MPENEQVVYKYVYKKSSFTMLAFTILTFAITWGVASAVNVAVGGFGAGTVGGLSSLSIGAIGAGIYAGMNYLSGTTFSDAQSAWAGSSGNGVLKPKTGSWGPHQRRMVTGLNNVHTYSRVGAGLNGVQNFYRGNCDESKSIAQCHSEGKTAGTMYRPDSYAETNTTLILSERKNKCLAAIPLSRLSLAASDPVEKEILRREIQQFASPRDGTWKTEW